MRADADQWNSLAPSLLVAARRGDRTALGQLMELFRPYLLSIANEEIAGSIQPKGGPADVVQDTFLEAQRLLDRFHGSQGEEFRAWLRAILLHKLSELHNHFFAVQKRELNREQSLDDSSEGVRMRDLVPDDQTSPSGALSRKEEKERVERALQRLSEVHQQVIRWRTWEGLTFAEIGARLQRSEDAARMLFGRALERLAEELERDGGQTPPSQSA